MKLYMYYLMYPKYEEYSRERDSFENFIDFIDPLPHTENDTHIIYLYAFTSKKKLAKEFESIHNMNKFTKKILSIDSEEYEEILSNNNMKLAKLDYMNIHRRSIRRSKPIEVTRLLCSEVEEEFLSDFMYAYLDEDLDNTTTWPYDMINPKYIPSLDILLYCTCHKMYNGSEDERDSVSYNWSFGSTCEGYGVQLSYDLNYLSIYMKTFMYILSE